MALVVVRPGLHSTVQDHGRAGSRHLGVPAAGAADRGAFDLANALLGNPPGSAALELTLLGGSYRAEVDLAVALAGAPMVAHVESPDGSTRPWAVPQAGTLRAGAVLHLGGSPAGARCYLAVRGGWQTPVVLGSRSTEVPLRAGDRLPAAAGVAATRRPGPLVASAFGLAPTDCPSLRFVRGRDLAPDPTLTAATYCVLDRSNRIGVRLQGAPIAVDADPDRPSAPVVPGTIQVAGGQPIVLGVAGGTIGGYPVVGHVIAADLDALGQLRPGDRATFAAVAPAEARRLDAAARRLRRAWQSRLAIWAGV